MRRVLAFALAASALGTCLAEPQWIDVEPQILPVAVAEDSASLSAACATFDTWWRVACELAPYRRGAVMVIR